MRFPLRLASLAVLGALLAVTACGGETPVTTAATPCPSPTPVPEAPKASILGQAFAPRQLLGQATTPNSFLEEAAVPEGVVTLTDAGGYPIPGMPTTKTNAQGQFVLEGVPAGASYVVDVAFPPLRGGTIHLKALVKVKDNGAAIRVGTATTLLTQALVDRRKGLVADFDERAFVTGIQAIAAGLTNLNVPDLSQPSEALAAVEAWSGVSPLLRDAYYRLQQDVAGNPAKPTPAPATPTPTPTPVPTDDGVPVEQSTPVPPLAATVKMTDFTYSPETVTIRQGGTVTFVNEDVAPHTATPIDQANFIGTGVIEPGMSSSPIRFDTVGEHPFGDNFYSYMRGTVIVLAAPTPTPTANPTTEPAPSASPTPTPTPQPTQAPGTVQTLSASTAGALSSPEGIAVDTLGNVYVADTANNRIRKITPDGVISTLAGSGAYGYADGPASTAAFKAPKAVAVDTVGNVYVADLLNRRVRRIDTRLAPSDAGFVTTFAGSGAIGSADGPGAVASFRSPVGLACDPAGYVYVADNENHLIRRIAPDGTVKTIAGQVDFGSGTVPQPGWQDGPGLNARFAYPSGLCFVNGALYVADNNNNAIRKITFDQAAAATVGTLVGTNPPVTSGLATVDPRFTLPVGLAVDSTGTVYTSHFNKNQILRYRAGTVEVFAGNGAAGNADGPLGTATFNGPHGLALGPDGRLYVVDTNNHLVRRILP